MLPARFKLVALQRRKHPRFYKATAYTEPTYLFSTAPKRHLLGQLSVNALATVCIGQADVTRRAPFAMLDLVHGGIIAHIYLIWPSSLTVSEITTYR